MAISQEQVDAWFAENPNATADDVAKAVQGIGGLEANQGLAGMIANRYSIAEPEVTNYYNQFTAPATGGIASLQTQPTVQETQVVTPTVTTVPTVTTLPTVTTQPTTQTVTTTPTVTADQTDETAVTTQPTTSAVDTLVNQILGQNLTSKWSGEGFGSAASNAADMAKILNSIGITDITQFGEITKTIPAHQEIQGGENGDIVVDVPEQIVKTYGNKLTGQEVPNTYSERQTGNAWGGTFTGSGNTGYRVQFDAQGNPYFYTTGASSNDLAMCCTKSRLDYPWCV